MLQDSTELPQKQRRFLDEGDDSTETAKKMADADDDEIANVDVAAETTTRFETMCRQMYYERPEPVDRTIKSKWHSGKRCWAATNPGLWKDFSKDPGPVWETNIFKKPTGAPSTKVPIHLMTGGGIASRPHVRASKLRCWKQTGMKAGYSRWRDMQLFMNVKMSRILSKKADISILHKSQSYDWNPKTLDELTENDPNPDADIRFFDSSKSKPPIISPFSFLSDAYVKKEENRAVQLALVGTYQHICICLIHRKEKVIEFFDSRGPNAEYEQIKRFFMQRFDGFSFENANPDFDIQAEDHQAKQADERARDIFCHTWIYLYSYRRLILNEDTMTILKSLVLLSANERLAEIKRFQEWLYAFDDTSDVESHIRYAPKKAPKGRGYYSF
eukprot:g106.t1